MLLPVCNSMGIYKCCSLEELSTFFGPKSSRNISYGVPSIKISYQLLVPVKFTEQFELHNALPSLNCTGMAPVNVQDYSIT